ncbi:Wzz/FepE/Etk N-terminal domain-containing protein [Cohnella cholangitidis]|uniref:Polysaccharide chain length determinant N-terminal domain-containing protein n=1 Tax=Cohnella cholangitidis TaxID=2598458 RepID=A0A7G5BXP1_9BACL|nr:Wzz/FepE/Etk N-terminal domain-containing protein [Cohnella cholangitidis]QMV41725.1 hypothetical protein FPL14_11410 [Cohnella cholangitidis]
MDQEISLREIIEIILKGKWIVISVTLVAILLSGIFSFFVLPPTYESNSLVRIATANEEGAEQLDISTFIESVKSDTAINRLIEKLQLDQSKYTIGSIRSLIHLEALKDINVMKIKVKGKDSLLITNIANLLAYELANRIEITDRSKSIVEFQSKLKELTDEIISTKSQLTEAQNQLKLIPEKQSTKQFILDNPLLSSIIKDSTKASISELSEIEMNGETINPAYTTLQGQIATLSITLTGLNADESNMKKRLKEYSERIVLLENQIQQDKLSVKSSDRLLDGYQATFISPAIHSTVPIGPNKLMNMIIAAFVGGIISVLIVFFRHYMRNTLKSLTSIGE